MEQLYAYSAKTNSFFALDLKDLYVSAGTWPEDAVPVTDDIYKEFSEHFEDKVRVAAKSGSPKWQAVTIDTRPARENIKKSRLVEARDHIEILKDAVSLGKASKEDKQKLQDWMAYRVELYKVDTSLEDSEFPPVPE